MPGYSKEELERVISIVTKKVEDARERSDDREVALHSQALNELTQELGQMLAQEELASRAQAQQNEAMQANLQAEQSQMQETMRTMQTMGKRRARQAWSATKKHAPKVAAGAAAGVAAGAMWTHDQAKQGLQKAAQGAGYAVDKTNEAYVRHQDTIQGTFHFILITIAVIGFEYFSAVNGNWAARFGFYGTLVAYLWAVTQDVSFAKRAGMAALIINAGWWLYLSGTQVDLLNSIFGDRAAIAVATLILLPGMIWYLLFFEPRFQIAGIIKKPVVTVVVIVIFFAFVFPVITQAGGMVPTPAGGFDTQEAARDAFQFTLAGFGEGFGNFACWLGLDSTCGFAGWLNEQIAPFAYDATTVHELQNKNLGVFIIEADDRKSFTLNPNSGFEYLPSGVQFKINAPIPQDLEFEFCSVENSMLKGFGGLCNSSIVLSCASDVSGTIVEPVDTLTISQAVSSQGRLFTCRIAPPTQDIRSAEVTLKAAYPFVTNTYKLLRAVDGRRSYTNDEIRELNSFSDDFIISTGGPVIIETDESNYISVTGPGHREQFIINFKAQKDVRLKAINSIHIYVPDGAELIDRPGSFCEVTPIPMNDERPVCTVFEQECQIEQLYGESIGACELARECREDTYTIRSGTIYALTEQSIQNASFNLGSTRGTSNEVQIGCELNITNPDLFLNTNQLVTERAINVIARYDVEHEITSRIAFDGNAPTIPLGSYQGTSEMCTVSKPDVSVTIPTGINPVAERFVITQYYGGQIITSSGKELYGKDGHRGLDLDVVGLGKDTIIAAWSGTVVRVCPSAECPGGWSTFGNTVVLRTKLPNGGSFDHIYAHLHSTSVGVGDRISQGQKIGTGGNTGLSIAGVGGDGSHLHFELRKNYGDSTTHFDPLPHIYHESLAANTKYQQARRLVSCQPVVAYSDRSNSEIRASVIAAMQNPSPEQVQNVDRIIAASRKHSIPIEVALAVAWQESREFKHTSGNQVIGIDRPDIGLLQINHNRTSLTAEQKKTGITYCGETTRAAGHIPLSGATPILEDPEYTALLSNPDFNALCGMEILKGKYDDNARLLSRWGFICGTVDGCSEGSECANLTGWKAAAKAYNGWSCGSGALNYPNSVESHFATLGLEIPSGWT